VTFKRVKGHEYVYFAYYDAETRAKKEIYVGPKNRQTTMPKALQYYKELLDLQQTRLAKKYQKLAKLVEEVEKRKPINL
jgi:hypothetical protein